MRARRADDERVAGAEGCSGFGRQFHRAADRSAGVGLAEEDALDVFDALVGEFAAGFDLHLGGHVGDAGDEVDESTFVPRDMATTIGAASVLALNATST